MATMLDQQNGIVLPENTENSGVGFVPQTYPGRGVKAHYLESFVDLRYNQQLMVYKGNNQIITTVAGY
ncbi:hypothetical protein [Cyclobacterium plantarum]|uniref:hypothetical protein n=1 Tax=Cyclobacterium plantarum TaxID=2716263 RepID=UPI003F702F4E